MKQTKPADNRDSHRKLVRKLVLLAVGMFGFAFALVPIYDIICEVTGLNGKTSAQASLIEEIESFIGAHNETPEPFVWTAKAEDILKKFRRARAVLDSKAN